MEAKGPSARLRVQSEGNQTKRSSFPHRCTADREIKAIVGNKDIPLHKIKFNKSYHGTKLDKTSFDRWAFVPFREFKHTLLKRDGPSLGKSLDVQKQQLTQMNSTSELTLKKYMTRKERKIYNQKKYFSQMANPLIAWRKNQDNKPHTVDLNSAIFSQEQQQHLNRLKAFLGTNNANKQKGKPIFGQTQLKTNLMDNEQMDSQQFVPMSLKRTDFKNKKFLIKSQKKKMKNSLGRWDVTEQ